MSPEIEEKVRNAPSLTNTAKALLQVCDGGPTTVDDLIKVVKKDSDLLKSVVDKASQIHFVRHGERVSSIEIAVNLLGDNKVMNLIADSCPPQFLFDALPGYAGEKGALWEYCLASGIATREISFYARTEIDPVTAYLGGLFHAIGKVLMSELMAGKTEQALEAVAKDEQVDFLEVERQCTGIDHCELGAHLASKWDLPEAFSQILQFYQRPSMADGLYQPLVYCVHVGSCMAMMSGLGSMADTLRYKLDSSYTNHISINTENFEHLVFNVHNEFQEIIKQVEVSQ
jgi:HD-like signal output (HDOD) protein